MHESIKTQKDVGSMFGGKFDKQVHDDFDDILSTLHLGEKQRKEDADTAISELKKYLNDFDEFLKLCDKTAKDLDKLLTKRASGNDRQVHVVHNRLSTYSNRLLNNFHRCQISFEKNKMIIAYAYPDYANKLETYFERGVKDLEKVVESYKTKLEQVKKTLQLAGETYE